MPADAALPPLRLIEPLRQPPERLASGPVEVDVDGRPAVLDLRLEGASEGDAAIRALSFGVELVRARRMRGVGCARVTLRTSPEGCPAESLAIPHLLAWRTPDDVLAVWEELPPAEAARVLDAAPETIARWAARAPDLAWLARSAPVAHAREGEHLSFRWVVGNESLVARLLSRRTVRFGHVSLHLAPDECSVALRVLTEVLGLVEVARPASIPTPGHWLQCDDVSVHLNTRSRRPDDVAFPGMAPNHICFVVADLDDASARLAALGIDSTRAGSLGNQLWFRLPGGHVVELQAVPA